MDIGTRGNLAAQNAGLWRAGKFCWQTRQRPVLMGILNLTPDSFSDGGRYGSVEEAVEAGLRMVEEGADVLDLGGESTRPGAKPVPLEEELRRVLPVLEQLRGRTEAALSIDTSKAEVARRALELGADIVNDVTGLRGDERMVEVVAASQCGVVVMHMQGSPQTMQLAPTYEDAPREVFAFLRQRLAELIRAGISPERICLDPGIGFGKTHEHNRQILQCIGELVSLGRPVLLGVSRKSFLAHAAEAHEIRDRLWPSIAVALWAREQGVGIFRVHDVKPHAEALKVLDTIVSYA